MTAPRRRENSLFNLREKKFISGIYPGTAMSHSLSDRYPAMLSSEQIHLNGEYDLWLRIAGDGQAMARYAVQNYPRSGTVYPVTTLKDKSWYWQKFDLKYWNSDDIHIEMVTAADAPLLIKKEDRSWFAIREAVLQKRGEPPPPAEPREDLLPLYLAANQNPPKSRQDLIDLLTGVIASSITNWREGSISDSEALLLQSLLDFELLPNDLRSLNTVEAALNKYREIESKIPSWKRSPGLLEFTGSDHPLYDRGDHKKPAHQVSRRFLEAIDSTPYDTTLSGRMNLAEDLLLDDNPLTTRVIVNRIWHYVFGQGLVTTPDNFGRLGEKPSHPEMLDYLAARFRKKGWSIKDTIRFLLTSDTWQASSVPSQNAKEQDPANRLLSHAHVRRLEGEAIRDSLMALSGQLNDEGTNRGVYLPVRRNNLDSFVSTFDAPVPFATKGRRDQTNVPAQSLTLLNDPLVIDSAKRFAASTEALANSTARINEMFLRATGREPTTTEVRNAEQFLSTLRTQYADMEKRQEAIRGKLAQLTQKRGFHSRPSSRTTAGETLLSEKTAKTAHASFPLGF